MDINKIARMVTEFCCAPNAIACKKTSHLRNEAWLHRDNLVDWRSITRLSFTGAPNAATGVVLWTPWAAMCLAKLTSNTQRWVCLTSKKWIKGESSIAQAEKGKQKEDDIGDDASRAILAEKAIGYVDKSILGLPPLKSLSQPHCGNQAGWIASQKPKIDL